MTTPSGQSSDLIFSITCSEKQVSSMFGGIVPADPEARRKAFRNSDKRDLPSFQEAEETDLPEYVPLRKISDMELSPGSSEPIMIPSETVSVNLSPCDGESQKNLSRSFEDSRPRSLEMETEKESTNSKGGSLG